MLTTIEQSERHKNKTSEKYSFISTNRIVNVFEENNFKLMDIQETFARKDIDKGFQKHLLTFRHFENLVNVNKKNSIDIVCLNSHNGTSPLKLMLMNLEFACLNGLIVGERFQDYKIYHRGFTDNKVNNAIENILTQTGEIESLRSEMQNKILHNNVKRDFAKQSLDIFFNNGFNRNKFNEFETIERLNKPQRIEDNNNSLWSQFNIVQEKMISGCNTNTSQKGFLVKSNFDIKTNNPINAIDRKVKINRNLWDLAESYLNN